MSGYDEESTAAAIEYVQKIQKKNKVEAERRYDRRKWSREGNEALQKWNDGTYFDDVHQPEPEQSRKFRQVKVTQPEQESIQQKVVKVITKGMDERQARYERRKASRQSQPEQPSRKSGMDRETVRKYQEKADSAMRGAKAAGKKATSTLANKLSGHKQERVRDRETVERVEKALKPVKSAKYPAKIDAKPQSKAFQAPTVVKHNPAQVKTRSQELREITEKAYQKQLAAEEKKQIAKENARAERAGARKGMSVLDATVDRIAEVGEKKREFGSRIDEIRERVAPGSTKAKPRASQAKPVAKLSAAQKKRIEQQVARAAKAIAPKRIKSFSSKRGAGPVVQKSTGSLNRKNTSALNKPRISSLNSPTKGGFGSRKGNPFGSSHRGNPFGGSRKGNPLGLSKVSNPIGYSSKSKKVVL
jgi:hypothetical protein